jgi:hypothetical protein
MIEKSYSAIQFFHVIFAVWKPAGFFPGVLRAISFEAEIKPVEPEQGNSCEGKVSKYFLLPSPVCISLFPN